MARLVYNPVTKHWYPVTPPGRKHSRTGYTKGLWKGKRGGAH